MVNTHHTNYYDLWAKLARIPLQFDEMILALKRMQELQDMLKLRIKEESSSGVIIYADDLLRFIETGEQPNHPWMRNAQLERR